MITKDEVEQILDNYTVVKEYPNSGQKKVFLVQGDGSYKIAKIVRRGDERVLREIAIVTEHEIPHVPKVYEVRDVNDSSGKEYSCIFEQYLDGITLREKLRVDKQLNLAEGISLLETLLNIAVVLEEIKTVHRDIKPDNIICTLDGQYYLIDFGIARRLDKMSLTMTQAAVGPHTPGYGAPELFQYSKKDINIKSDLFSIGVVLFESFTGQHPFLTGEEVDINEVWYRTRTVMPKDYLIEGDNDKQLISFIQTLMQKHPTRRPATAKKAIEWFHALTSTLNIGGE